MAGRQGSPYEKPTAVHTRTLTSETPNLFGNGLALYCAGDLSLLDQPSVAIVGTRNVSADGAARARRLARELAARDVVVVSGLAHGVDTEALGAALEARGRVIAVIGTGLDIAYPARNKRMQEQIWREHLLVSQFAAGTRVYKSNFPARNKTMAHIARATVIVEAGSTSGTIHQASACVKQGRPLFFMRSFVDNPDVTWPASFLSEPTVSVLDTVDDVLAVL